MPSIAFQHGEGIGQQILSKAGAWTSKLPITVGISAASVRITAGPRRLQRRDQKLMFLTTGDM